ncbi:hypothetical protein OEB99_12085 [Actinotalea sp. M2MS4P-6]|uniref:hypothetical protein n=1 Tax=Actinotalea sp. M2MS4P-6 TaxID=2983762 RepID=UPI0021E3E4EE|nr:hypothetical protein [Actinotalea sp. M2MS4P-6]MCV2395049.1 hypothetical protein [Actinotalea sp. M2MS4P-6]
MSSRFVRRRAALVALAVAAAATLSACAPEMTSRPYAASDGIDVTVGALRGGNLLVLTAAEGDPGTVLGSLTNTGEAAITAQVGSPDAPVTVQIEPGATALLGPDHVEVAIASVPAPPGALTTIMVASDVDGSATVDVPVLDGTLEAYASLVPTP